MSLKGKIALIIDDDPVLLRVLDQVLSTAGLSVFSAPSLAQALSMLTQLMPHIVLLDLKLSGEEGLELLQNHNQLTKGVPILVISASQDAELIDLSLALGASDFLAKPIEPQLLLQKLRKILDGDEFVTFNFTEDTAPLVRFKIPVTIDAAIGQGFRVEAGIRFAANCALKLWPLFSESIGFTDGIPVRTAPKKGSLIRRGSFWNELRIPGMNREQIKQFENFIRSWHTR